MQVTKLAHLMLRSAIYSGSNSRSFIPNLFKGLGAQRVVLFSDKGLEQAGIVEMVAQIFNTSLSETAPKLVGIYTDIAQDAESQSVNNAVIFAKEVEADGLLALGGGSVLDTVKGVKYALYKGLSDIKEAIPSGLLYEQFPKANHIPIPHIAVPTTAGTGSEVSPISVIYNEEIQKKVSIINPFISADIAVLDPDLTVGLPPNVTAFTGFDALNPMSEELIKMIGKKVMP